MTYFWAYVIGSDGHFQTAHSMKCENDEAAVDASRRSVALDGRAVVKAVDAGGTARTESQSWRVTRDP
jgi:hypothetical protein